MIESITVAFGAGMVATINPCGFAMLPAYLSYFLGMEDRSSDARAGVLRALKVGLAVSAGFLTVFGTLGILITPFKDAIQSKLPYVTSLFGVGIIVLGLAMLRGYEPLITFLPKMQKGTSGRELPAMFLFGLSYAISSLSCTIPLFILNVANTFTQQNLAAGVVVFLAYGLGMALVLMALTLAIALARQGIVANIRRVLPYVNRISGVLLVLAGVYLTYYGWWEVQVLNGNLDPGGPARTIAAWNNDLLNWVNQTGPVRIGIVLAGFLVVAVLIATSWRAGQCRDHARSGDRR